MKKLFALFCSALLLHFRMALPSLFTHDPEIIYTTGQLLYVAAAFQVADGVNASIQGIFRGSGRQSLSALLNFVAYYIVGLPLGILFAFHFHYGVMGLWVGISIGLFLAPICGYLYVAKSDWKALAQEAKQRVDV